MRTWIQYVACLLTCLLLTGARAHPPASAQEGDYERLRAQAEAFFAEAAYTRARETYEKVDTAGLPADQASWVTFRIADARWRALSGSNNPDPSRLEEARAALAELLEGYERPETHDRVWAEIQESLGDFYWTRNQSINFYQAWQHYQQALSWWAKQSDLDLARRRYLDVVWRAAWPDRGNQRSFYGSWGNRIPLDVCDDVLRIAVTPEDRAAAHYLMACELQNQGGQALTARRVPAHFEAALEVGRRGADGEPVRWYDHALYSYGQFLEHRGTASVSEDGLLELKPDYVRAAEVYERLLREFQKGESRFYDQARQALQNIRRRTVDLAVGGAFLPKSEVEFALSWRNTEAVDLALYPVDLTRDVNLRGKDQRGHEYLAAIDLSGRRSTWSERYETGDDGRHAPGTTTRRITPALADGAYVLEARAGGAESRALVLVSRSAVALKATPTRGLVYFGDAQTGEPLAGAEVTVHQRVHDGGRWLWRRSTKRTDEDGLAVVDWKEGERHGELWCAARLGERQAFSQGGSPASNMTAPQWKFYAFTDRSTYRPGDEVRWKLIGRIGQDGEWTTPSGEELEYAIRDPRSNEVASGTLKLGAFGGAFDAFTTEESMTLGEYSIQFWSVGRKRGFGGARLFRLEEYKLPEFEVTVRAAQDERDAGNRLGDAVDVEVQAEYFFGGKVANAEVEVIVHSRPYYPRYVPRRSYAWFHEPPPGPQYWGRGQPVLNKTLRTDAQGRVVFTIETPPDSRNDLEYSVEARVVDASRREVVGNGTLRVTRQPYYVYPRTERRVYRPGDEVEVEVQVLDADERPVETAGELVFERERHVEVWRDPEGREVRGRELDELKRRGAFPPVTGPRERPWHLYEVRTEYERVATRAVRTDEEGRATATLKAGIEGSYRVRWSSRDELGLPITAETRYYVATERLAYTGFRPGGVQIVVDDKSFRQGERAPVLLTVPASGRWVLFTVEGEDLMEQRLVRVDGSAKLIYVDLEARHVPDVYFTATLFSDFEVFADQTLVVVPPVEQFLTVEVEPDQDAYLPGAAGRVGLRVRDSEGRPVSAEVALSVVDESLLALQEDYAEDLRQAYYGPRRRLWVSSTSTFHQLPYRRLVEDKDGGLVDERYAWYEDGGGSDEFFLGEPRSSGRRGQKEGRQYRGPGDTLAPRAETAFFDSAIGIGGGAGGWGGPEASTRAPMGAPADGGSSGTVEVRVRSDFRETAHWEAAVVTDEEGRATIDVEFPDNLTRWRVRARAADTGSRFGDASAETRTRQPLVVRPQVPRFFTVGDELRIAAVLNNRTEAAVRVEPRIEVEGLALLGALAADGGLRREPEPVVIPALGEARVEWRVRADLEGTARIRMEARGAEVADGVERTYKVVPHGIEALVAKSTKMRGSEVAISLDLPAERRPGSSRLEVRVTPSLAVTMLDALPYLVHYPYGCTEQTLSRFVPAMACARVLGKLGLSMDDVAARSFGGIEEDSADATHPLGRGAYRELEQVTERGLERLYDFQHGDGSWSWWKDGDGDPFMTAYVVWGLTLAREAGVDVRESVLERGAQWLATEIVEAQDQPELAAWMLHAVEAFRASGGELGEAERFVEPAFEELWRRRRALNAYGRALLALSAHAGGRRDQAESLARSLQDGAIVDRTPDTSIVMRGESEHDEVVQATCHWGEDGVYRRWSEGGVEATAFCLKALLAIDPQNELVEPTANWLLKNRRGAQWNNTRDTAIVVLAMLDYLEVTGELGAGVAYEVEFGGELVGQVELTREGLLRAPELFVVPDAALRAGENVVRVRRTNGASPLYVSARASFFSTEVPIPARGHEVFVRREYRRLVGRPTLLEGLVYEKVPLRDGDELRSGERVEVVLTIEAKNHLEYMLFEDKKPAGLEAVDLLSGEPTYVRELTELEAAHRMAPDPDEGPAAGGVRAPRGEDGQGYTGRSRRSHREQRTEHVALFVDRLPQGYWEVRYLLRAEVPGTFHALPTLAQAMYVPEIRGNSEEVRLRVLDRE